MAITQIIFWFLLIDSLIGNYIAWTKYQEHFNKLQFFKRYLPISKGWMAWYLILVLFIGWLVY